MLVDYAILAGGLGLLLFGGWLLVKGASGIATGLGVSPMIVGLTVVAFGTSAPELAVNILASKAGSGDMAFGNVIGSNFANIGIILGLSALLRPLDIHGIIVRREIPMMLLATAAALVLGLSSDLTWSAGNYDRSDGVVLLLFFSVFLYTSINEGISQRRDPVLREAGESESSSTKAAMLPSILFTLAGLAALVYGGDRTVESAATIARGLGMSEAVVGLTVVAIGTSLPELVTSIIAAFRGQTDIAVGNVVGSNIFNLLLVLGTSSAILPVSVPDGGLTDLAAVAVVSILCMVFSLYRENRISRIEGFLLLASWAGYTYWRVSEVL